MKVKLRRGPEAGKVTEFDSKYMDRIIYQVNEPVNYWDLGMSPYAVTPPKRGHYQRTNITTKKGLPVYEWMGWEGEISG